MIKTSKSADVPEDMEHLVSAYNENSKIELLDIVDFHYKFAPLFKMKMEELGD